MGLLEKRHFFSRKHRGLLLSFSYRLSQQDSFSHLALVAPTGSGKTTRYVIPNILDAQGSVVVTDPAGEVYRATQRHLRQRGFTLQTLRPADLKRSERFNPLSFWKEPQQLRQLATMLSDASQGVNSDPFWSTSGVNLLYIALSSLAGLNERSRTLGNLRRLLNSLDTKKHAESWIEQQLGSPDRIAEYRAFHAQDAKVRSSILSTARTAIEMWADDDVVDLTSSHTVDITALRRRPTALFLIVPEHQIRYFAPILNLVYSACFAHCLETGQRSGDGDLPVYFFLDEFGNLGRIHNFAAMITTLRKRRCSISIILQELSQLRAVYGRDEAQIIFSGGCANKLFLSGLDLETAEYLERVLGTRTEHDTIFGGWSQVARTAPVPLLRADEIRMLSSEKGILVSGRQRPALLRLAGHKATAAP